MSLVEFCGLSLVNGISKQTDMAVLLFILLIVLWWASYKSINWFDKI